MRRVPPPGITAPTRASFPSVTSVTSALPRGAPRAGFPGARPDLLAPELPVLPGGVRRIATPVPDCRSRTSSTQVCVTPSSDGE
eukprot:12004235-Alexandrium_andersonii.AAC.1